MPTKKPKPAATTKDELVQINLRLPKSLLERLDAWIEDEIAARPGIGVTRTDLIRQAVYQALDAREKSKPTK